MALGVGDLCHISIHVLREEDDGRNNHGRL